MIKIWFLLMLISMPSQPSVKYTAYIYPSEEACVVARDGYNLAYAAKDPHYKSRIKSKAFCIPFESFPIAGLQAPTGA
tara:strand:+ start:485 stop:718 length:234 start_codon:yes stop_codon:yes gene_type:complete